MMENSSQFTVHSAQNAERSAQMSDDALLEQFFSQARTQEIADDGFTDRVMHRLPDRAWQLSRLWTLFCLVLGVVLFVAFKGWLPVLWSFHAMVNNGLTDVPLVPLFVTAGALCSLTVAEVANRFYTE